MDKELREQIEEVKEEMFMLSYRVEKGTGKESVDFRSLAKFHLQRTLEAKIEGHSGPCDICCQNIDNFKCSVTEKYLTQLQQLKDG
jgi:tRNA U54 and U55 pseudouridine synthase Pus10